MRQIIPEYTPEQQAILGHLKEELRATDEDTQAARERMHAELPGALAAGEGGRSWRFAWSELMRRQAARREVIVHELVRLHQLFETVNGGVTYILTHEEANELRGPLEIGG